MTDQEKIQGVFRLITMLSGPRKYQMREMAERLEVVPRTVYRYLNIIENTGFLLERKNGYRLKKENHAVKDLNGLFHFTEEELYAIHNLLEEAQTKSPTNKKLIKKLHTLYDFKALARLREKSELDHIDVLKKAIESKKQAVLQAYRSSHSQTIKDRKVEPFAFLPDYRGVWCFDTDDLQNKQFFLSRIKEVCATEKKWFYRERHQIPFTDAFRMGAQEPMATVKLQMSLKAFNLLKDEYPVAMKYVKPSGKSFLLVMPVAAFEGVGRFVMGLPEDIKIIDPQGFKDYLKEKRKKLFATDRI